MFIGRIQLKREGLKRYSLFFKAAGGMQRGSLFVDAALSISIFVTAMCLLLAATLRIGREADAVLDMYKTQDYGNTALSYFGQPIDQDIVLCKEGHYLVYWPFCGEPKEAAEEKVYIFPKRGEKYHYVGCSTMKNGERIILLSAAVKRQYDPCKLCKPSTLPNGSRICIYGENSHTYHRTSCPTVSKSYECIAKSVAEEMGYTECKLCSPNSKIDYGF